MGHLNFLHSYPFGKHWAFLTDDEQQSVAKEVLAEFFCAVEAHETGSNHSPIKVIYLDNER
jgi:hypothetical protein